MNQRFRQLILQISTGLYEREAEVSLSLLAALSGESIILLGPPGVAKSFVARRLASAFLHAHTFEYLMSRFSTPDEIFGPVSIAKLKANDTYERVTTGYLPTADVVFLDEIWKAGPAIQNTLLTVINEKLFRNGNRELPLPLKLLVAASNELPARGEGLEALWDRFLLRLECQPIKQEAHFLDLLRSTSTDTDFHLSDESIAIRNEEYAQWSRQINEIPICDTALQCLVDIRRALHAIAVEGTDERRDIYISDRRWKKIARLVRTSAFMHDRKEASLTDLLPVYHCLWQEPDERDSVRHLVVKTIFMQDALKLATLKQRLDEDIRNHRMIVKHRRSTTTQRARDANKKAYNKFYYRLPTHETGRSFVVLSDFQQLPEIGTTAASGVLYADSRNEEVTIIRCNDGNRVPLGSRPVSLSRDDDHLFIDGVAYALELSKVEKEFELPLTEEQELQDDYATALETLGEHVAAIERSLSDSLFICEDDRREIKHYLADFYKEIAFTRQDLAKIEG